MPEIQVRADLQTINMPFFIMDDFRLRVFLEVVRTGSFTRAAERLKISQPAVSQNIAELESSLGVSLFDRSRQSVRLSGEGELFKSYADRIVYWCSAAEKMFSAAVRNSPVREVRIEAGDDMLSCVLPGVLRAVLSVNPDIRFRLESGSGTGTDPDVTIFTDVLKEETGTVPGNVMLGYSHACLVVSARNPLPLKRESNERPPVPGCDIAYWTGPGPASGVLPPDMLTDVRLESSSVETVRRSVLDSAHMAGILPYHAVMEDVEEGRLVMLPLREPLYTIKAGLVFSDGFSRTSLAGLLYRKLRDYFTGQ